MYGLRSPTLLIPGHNDTDHELQEMTAWVVEHLDQTFPCTSQPFTPTGGCAMFPTLRRKL